ncbi:MAG: methyltransferase domain-containing protein, partial [Acidobacteriota bacterium]|nr:methyltransferase domain-containing protein [Acidobacteriota bacterium]
VQGSVLDPPFLPDTFDYIFSLGVLHHTPDPRRGCIELSKLLRPEGAISVWVYPPDYWGGRISSPFRKRVHKIVSRLPPEKSFEVCRRWLYPLGRVQMALARRRWTKLLAAPLFIVGVPRHPQKGVMIATIHDYYGAPIISTHTYDEVRGWLKEAGFKLLRKVPVPTGWFAQGRGQTEQQP